MKKRNLIACILILILLLLFASACQKKAESFAFEKSELTIAVGQRVAPKVVAYPEDRAYSLQAENPTIVTVEGKEIIGLKIGVTYVNAVSGNFTDTLKVIVGDATGKLPDVDIFYTLSFQTDYGSAPESVAVLEGDYAQNPGSLANIGGYKFTGWYIDNQGTQLFDFESVQIYDHYTLYAGWEIDPTINFSYTTENEKWVINGFHYADVPYEVVNFPIYSPELSPVGKMAIQGISAEAFKGNTTLTEIIIPSSYEYIGQEAFANVKNLKKVTFIGSEQELISIENKVFCNCSALEEVVNLPDSITSIGELAFYNTEKLANFSFPNALEKIEEGAFADSGIAGADIKGVSIIGKEAFAYSKLEQFTCTEELTDIGVDAFLATPWQNGILQADNYIEVNNILLKVNLNSSNPSFDMPTNIAKVASACFTYEGAEIMLSTGHFPEFMSDSLPQNYDIIVASAALQSYLDYYPAEIAGNIWCLHSNYNVDGKYTFELLERGASGDIVIKQCTTNENEINLVDIFTGKHIKKIKRTAFGSSCPNLAIVRLPSDAEQVSINAFNTVIRALFIKQVGSAILQLEGNPVLTTVSPAGYEYKLYIDSTGYSNKRQAYINAYSFLSASNTFDAAIVKEDGLCVNVVDDEAYIVQYLGWASSLTILDEYDSNPLVGISKYAFCGNKTLDALIIEDGSLPLGIGVNALYNMNSNMQFTIKRATPPALGENVFGSGSTAGYAIYVPADYVEIYKSAWVQYANIISAIE